MDIVHLKYENIAIKGCGECDIQFNKFSFYIGLNINLAYLL